MTKDDLIALGLRTFRATPAPAPASAVAVPAPAPVLDPFRSAVERLLALLRDFVAVVELADDGHLHERIEECRKAVVGATDVATLNRSVDLVNDTCRQVLAKIDRQRSEQKKEIASLVDMVREALAIVSGDGQAFTKDLGHSMDRFESLVRIDDVRQLKTQLVREISSLRSMAAERQKGFETTCEKFSHKIEMLERQLTLTKEEASLDGLTRVLNRGSFDRICQEWIANDHYQFVLGIVDVDDFKAINDTHGHGIGDRALVAVAQALKSSVRADSDVVARLGGDEFAVLLSDLNLRQAENRLRMVSAGLASVKFETPTNAPLKVTLSCGVAEFSAGDTVNSIMERADAALYEAKHLGKSRVIGKVKPTLRELLQH